PVRIAAFPLLSHLLRNLHFFGPRCCSIADSVYPHRLGSPAIVEFQPSRKLFSKPQTGSNGLGGREKMLAGTGALGPTPHGATEYTGKTGTGWGPWASARGKQPTG